MSTETLRISPNYTVAHWEELQQAVKAGFTDAAHLAKDPDLAPLRGRGDFRKLLAELDKKPAASPRQP